MSEHGIASLLIFLYDSKSHEQSLLLLLHYYPHTNIILYASLQCRSLLYFHYFPSHWYRTVQFHVGLVLFAIGAWINLQSDGILRNLSRQRLGKQPQQQAPPTSTVSATCTSKRPQHRQHQQQLQYRCNDYQIPTGGWFAYCSTPHYFGEIVQWTGFCIACQYSIASTSFCLFTAANLIPRGVAQHEWYQAHFNGNHNNSSNSNKKYPPHRKAVIPFLW
jgi:3-oxo-5-alpha-steroid 4-dehydrogenase 1